MTNNISENEIEFYARLSDETLDNHYHYGRSNSGFGWEANKGSARAALETISAGNTNLETIAAAIHSGWANVALSYEDPVYLQKPQKREARYKLAKTSYEQLPEEEKAKDRVVAEAILMHRQFQR